MYFITCFLKASFLSIQILPFSVEKVTLFSNLLKSGEPGCLKKKKKRKKKHILKALLLQLMLRISVTIHTLGTNKAG